MKRLSLLIVLLLAGTLHAQAAPHLKVMTPGVTRNHIGTTQTEVSFRFGIRVYDTAGVKSILELSYSGPNGPWVQQPGIGGFWMHNYWAPINGVIPWQSHIHYTVIPYNTGTIHARIRAQNVTNMNVITTLLRQVPQ